MNKVKVISMNRTSDKWLKLMLHLQNAPPLVHHCVFRNTAAARNAAGRMRKVVYDNPSWFPVIIMQRECDVWVFKNECVQKVVVNDE